ncbi:MAG: LUD domain-containing protein [Bacteroidales bacterium]
MERKERAFRAKSKVITLDREHRRKLDHNIGKYDEAVSRGVHFFNDLDNARSQAGKIKDYAIGDLENLLVRFEKQAMANGSEVHWACDEREALGILRSLVVKEKVELVVKMKSMISEELEINGLLKDLRVETYETDLGEFIVQLAGEKPYHILTPAMHKSKEDVAALFHEKFGLDAESTPSQITRFVRDFLRDKFIRADMGITGANFLISETGSVALTENEGNGLMTFSWPRILVVIAGIEKIIPELTDLGLFWPLVAVHGTGQHVTAYNSILSGPRSENEKNGPERMIIILLDGGRSRMYGDPELQKALTCIRCGACLNACPIYRNIGGYTYQTTYTGPIGSVISMYLDGSQDAGFLNFASSLCGKCSEVCPVQIPIHKLLLLNRSRINENSDKGAAEKLVLKATGRMLMRRNSLESIHPKWKNLAMKSLGKRLWGPRREPLVFARESFSRMYKKRHNNH